jgi:methylglyoxal synthase
VGIVRELRIRTDPAERPLIALIAHDAKKDELLRLCRSHRGLLERFRFLATEATGLLLEREIQLGCECVAAGPEGGDMQIGARIVEAEVDAVIFLRDPLTAHPHEPDIQALLKVCDVHSVPVATNAASADILLLHLARNERCSVRISHPSVFSDGRFPWDPDRTTPTGIGSRRRIP